MKNILIFLSVIFLLSCNEGAKMAEPKIHYEIEQPLKEEIPTPPKEEISTPPKEKLQSKKQPEAPKKPGFNINEIIPEGYNIVNTKEGKELIYGDLDQDGKEDVVMLIEFRGDTTLDQSEKVLLAIFTEDRHGQLQFASASENLGGEAVMYNDKKSLSVKNRVITYFHQSMRSHLVLKFRYDISAGDFLLIGKDFQNYGSIEEGPTSTSINYLTGVKLTDESKWDDEKEEAVPLPQKKETFKKEIQSLSTINWETMYNDV